MGLLVQASYANAAVPTSCMGRAATIVGTDGPDAIVGTPGPDVISAGDGNDQVSGRGGADVICGGRGDDTLYGGANADRINGDAGTDALVGGRGADRLLGGYGNDTILGQGEDDELRSGPGDVSVMEGGTGNDLLLGEGLLDVASFVTSANSIKASLKAGTAFGQGSDILTGLEGIIGSPFGDDLQGGPGLSLLIGEAGDDTLRGAGPTSLSLATYITADGPVSADLAAGTARDGTAGQAGHDRLVNLLGVVGGPFADTLSGSYVIELLLGMEGNDTLNGRGGDDFLFGMEGNDRLRGGDGNDRLDGGDGSDRFDGMGGTDTADFSAWNEGVTASLEAGTADEGGADLLANVENLLGTDFADDLTGDAGPNTLSGRAGPDVIRGRGAHDYLNGGPGQDTLNGGGADDLCLEGETHVACEATSISADPVSLTPRLAGPLQRLQPLTAPSASRRPVVRTPDSTLTPTSVSPAGTTNGIPGGWSFDPGPQCEYRALTDELTLTAFMPWTSPAYEEAGTRFPPQRIWFRAWYFDPVRGWLDGPWYYRDARNVVTDPVGFVFHPHLFANVTTPYADWFRADGQVQNFYFQNDQYSSRNRGGYQMWQQLYWDSNSAWPHTGEIGRYVPISVTDEFGGSRGTFPICTLL